MVLDSSAIVAIFLREPGWDQLLNRLEVATCRGIGAPTLVEAAMVLTNRLGDGAMSLLLEFCATQDIEIIPFSDAHGHAAIGAFLRFGKGRHPAALNYGDCLTYAVASVAEEPLMFVGDDFSRTDVVAV